MANPNQETQPNRPEVQPPQVPVRNLPEHEIQAEQQQGPREYHADQAGQSPAQKSPLGANKTIEPEAPAVRGEAAP